MIRGLKWGCFQGVEPLRPSPETGVQRARPNWPRRFVMKFASLVFALLMLLSAPGGLAIDGGFFMPIPAPAPTAVATPTPTPTPTPAATPNQLHETADASVLPTPAPTRSFFSVENILGLVALATLLFCGYMGMFHRPSPPRPMPPPHHH